MVTAQKRVENLQDVPVSVQVVSSRTLIEQNQNSLEELTQTVPSVHVATGTFANNLFIRGIGSGENPSFDQAVAMFVDDIYHGRSRMSAASFLDLDRIEVLKGPQSTFFGNNAVAGALNIVSQKPGTEFNASTRALYGEFGQYALEGAVGGPVTDTIGARVAVTRNGSSGWIENVDLDRHVPSINNLAGRITLTFEPGDDVDGTFKIEAGKHRASGSYLDQASQWANCPPPAPLAPANGGTGGSCAQALALGVPIGLDNDQTSGLPGQFNELENVESALTLNYHLGGHVLTSVTGFYDYGFDSNIGGDPIPVVIYTGQVKEDYQQFSQELRIASPTGGAIEYLAGLYFQTDELTQSQESNAPFLDFFALFVPPLAPYLPFANIQGFSQDEKVYSTFGSLSWNATARLKLTGSVRGSWVEKDMDQTLHYGTGTELYGGFVLLPPDIEPLWSSIFGAPGDVPRSRSDHAWMPSAHAQYQLNDSAMVYLSYSRGFKSGGFNGTGRLTVPGFDPEYVNAYEAGLKSKWLEDTLLMNLTVFRSDYTDLQVDAAVIQPATNTYGFEIRNAADAKTQGVELETQWAVTRGLRLAANVTYLDSSYASFPNGAPTTLQSFCTDAANNAANPTGCADFPLPVSPFHDYSGETTPFSPRWSGSVSARYTMTLAGDYRFMTELSPYFTSDYTINNDSFYSGYDGYVRLDARLNLEKEGGPWAIDLIGKNLNDRVIAAGSLIASKQQPRNVALQFRYHW